MLEFIEAGLPIGFSPMVQMGATGPFSFSGVLALENAEILLMEVPLQLPE